MSDEFVKHLIRIVNDYCFKNSSSSFVNEFSLFLAPKIVKPIKSNALTYREFKKIAEKRRDFFVANDLNSATFCKELYKNIIYELSFITADSFYDDIVNFKRVVENGNYRGFPKGTSEDTLRSTLSIYIREETFCEPRSSSGFNDITIPSQKTIIETKLWNGKEYYNAGFPELNDYLTKSNYREGYYVIFDYTQAPNEIVNSCGEIFDTTYEGKTIHVIFILMNRVPPSKIYKSKKQKA